MLILAATLRAGEPRQLEAFRFLIGAWVSTEGAGGNASPGSPTGNTVFSRGLLDRVIIRNSFAAYPAVAGKPAYRHEDLLVIFVEGDSTIKAEYFDNEGHSIHYTLESPAPGKAVFLSLNSPGVPRYRLTYALTSAGSLDGAFEIAPPGAGGNFAPYLKWTSKPDSAH
jgi:hypothetical protein